MYVCTIMDENSVGFIRISLGSIRINGVVCAYVNGHK